MSVWHTLRAVAKLSRANMTVISAVTYLAAAVTATRGAVDAGKYFAGWLFVVLTQFMTHFLGEVADAPSDRLNRFSSPVTGGSKVLPLNEASARLANTMGYLCALSAALVLRYLVPVQARRVGIAIQILAWAYSARPVSLNHCYLGEIDASVVTNALLPFFAAAVQGAVHGDWPWWDRRLAALVVPPFLVKLSLFLLLNLADRRPDWAAGKRTLSVALGDARSAYIHAFLMALAYIAAVFIALADRTPALLLFVLPSLPYGARISRTLLQGVPYRLSALLGPALFHSTLLVWGVLLHALVTSSVRQPRFYHAIAAAFLYITVINIRNGRRRAAAERAAATAAEKKQRELSDALRPLAPAASADISDITDESDSLSDSPDSPPVPRTPGHHVYADVVIIGAGISGLATASALARLGLDVLILERNQPHTKEPTAISTDVAAALAALRVSTHAPRASLLTMLRTQGVPIVHEAPLHRIAEDENAQRVIIHYADNAAIAARVVLGCDGAQSQVRAHVLQNGAAHWSTPRCALVGAAANSSAADSIAIATLLRQFWHEPDGHLESFYRYERARRSPAALWKMLSLARCSNVHDDVALFLHLAATRPS